MDAPNKDLLCDQHPSMLLLKEQAQGTDRPREGGIEVRGVQVLEVGSLEVIHLRRRDAGG